MRFGAQALFHVLSRNHDFLMEQLESFEYQSPEELEDAKARLDDIDQGAPQRVPQRDHARAERAGEAG